MKKLIPLLVILLLIAGCQKKSYKVTLDFTDGTIVEVTTDSNGHIRIPEHESKEGYKLAGWLYDGEIYPLNEKPITSDITLQALYLKVFHIRVINDLNNVSNYEVLQGEKFKSPAAPSKEGYYFNGWYLNGSLYDFETPVESNITLVANWLKIIKISYGYSEDAIIAEENVRIGDTLHFPKPEDREGYQFDGWYLNGRAVDEKTRLSEDTLLIARYRKLHTVTFVCNDIYSYTMLVADGESAQKPNDPVKANNRFLGWNHEGKPYDFSSAVSSDVVLIAQYVPIRTVVFNYGGTAPDRIVRVENGAVIIRPADPQKGGYIFVGWYEKDQPFDFEKPVRADAIIDAVFRKICTVTYVFENGEPNISVNVLEGELIEIPQEPVREGYEFSGWYHGDQLYDFQQPVSDSMVLTAGWKEKGEQ
ncbi:MAG: InlB B-repeat-containing protein [Erysipelotrichaceae bacterium]|nr:InlB B-repeat-containing protein [Erysipelotrichaceae bacterium]